MATNRGELIPRLRASLKEQNQEFMKATLPYSSAGSSRVYLVPYSIMGIPDEIIMGLAQVSEAPGPRRLPQMFRLSHVTGVPTCHLLVVVSAPHQDRGLAQ